MPRPPIPFRFIPLLRYALVFGVLQLSPIPALAQRQVEYLDRGLIAVGLSDVEVMVGWRMLGTDPLDILGCLCGVSFGFLPSRDL